MYSEADPGVQRWLIDTGSLKYRAWAMAPAGVNNQKITIRSIHPVSQKITIRSIHPVSQACL